MALRTATNPQTGERVAFVGGQWVPYTQSATNPETGERAIFVGGRWFTDSTPAPQGEESGFFRQALDLPVQAATGVATGIRLITDAFGADNIISRQIKGVENWLQDLLSAQAKEDQQEIARIMKEAEDKGVVDQVVAGLKAFSTAPLDYIAQAAGTVAPTLVGGLAAAALRAPAVVGLVGTGATMGAGTIKSSIYDATYEALREQGASEADARKRAELAQEYGGENLDQILIGTVLGGVAGRFGVEPALAKNLAGEITKRSVLKGAALEAAPEFVQAAQEQVAANVAQQREGFDVPTFRGAVGAGTLEALAGAGLGGGVELIRSATPAPAEEDLIRPGGEEPPPAPPEPTAAPSNVVDAAPEWLKGELASSSPEELTARIPDIQSRIDKFESLLADEPRLVDLAQKRGTDPEEAKQKTAEAIEQNRARLDFYIQRLQELGAPFDAGIPPAAPTATIDQPLAKQLDIVDVVTGDTPITVSAPTSEVPSAAAETAPGVAEPTEPEPVGGGVAVPPSRQEPEGRVPEVATSEGVESAPRVAGDAVPGEGGVEPALEPASVEPVAVPAEPAIPEVPTLREDATDAEVKAYYEAMQDRDVALGIKPTPRLRKKKSQPLQRGEVPSTPQVTPEEVQGVVGDTIRGWRNAPQVVVAANAEDPAIPEEVRQNLTPDTRGTYANGTVYVLADRAMDKASVRGTVFHESLGHFGLRDTFGTRLDNILDDIYKTNSDAKAAADELIQQYPDLTPARAVEEVLAKKSEAGPIKEAGLRAAFNRVAAFIRRAVRTMGIPLAYSNNDISQVLAQAHRRVTGAERKGTPTKAKGAKALVNIPSQMVKELNVLSSGQADGFRAAMSELGDAGRDFTYGMMSLPELVDAFKKTVPSLQGLLDVVNERAFELKQRRVKIEDKINKWTETLNKHKGQIDKFHSIALESTRLQVDFRSKEDNSLTKEFYTLHKDLQKVYFEMLDAYRKVGNEYIELVVKNLPETAANKLRAEFESQRLNIYLPLFRDGDYWLRYQDGKNETVVRAFTSKRERELAWAEALKDGAKSNSRQVYQKLDQVLADKRASSGFYSNVINELNDYYGGEIPLPVKQAIYEIFLDSIPASSVRQQFRKREGYQGAERDLIKVYATVASRMANQLNSLKFNPRIEEVNKLVNEDIQKALAEDDASAAGLARNVNAQLEFLRDPTNPKWVNLGVFASYFDFIVGNLSSAIANLTQMPMTVYPMLAGEYGLEKAREAMDYATRMWFSGGWDSQADEREVPKRFPADRTMYTPENIPPNSPLGRLFDRAFRENVIKHSAGYDLIEARERRVGLANYTGLKNKVVQTLGWAFQNTERFNREVTLVAAFRLAMEKGKAQGKTGSALENYAIKRAIRLTNETHGVALTEAGPRFFQKGALKIALTFKNFARTQYYLQYRLLKDALQGMDIDTTGMSPEDKAQAEQENREFRKMAAKQWLGVLGGAFTFAGVQGLPFYGAYVVLASLANAIPGIGDDDDLLDVDEQIKQSVGVTAYKGIVNQIFGADVAARTGFNGMFWRDDPKRVDEIGAALYTLEQLMGPLYGSVKSRLDALEDFQNGYNDRALEKSMPVFVRNMLKAWRFNQEGILTKNKTTKITEDSTAYEEFMQAVGFTPARISETTARAGAKAELVKKFEARRKSLLDRAYLAYVEQDYDEWNEALEDIAKHNNSKAAQELNMFISFDTLERSFRERTRRSQQAVDGLYFAPRIRPGVERIVKE